MVTVGVLPRLLSPHEAIVPAWVARAERVVLKEKLSYVQSTSDESFLDLIWLLKHAENKKPL